MNEIGSGRRGRCDGRRWRGACDCAFSCCRRFNFPIAAFFDAGAEISLLGAFFDDERRGAFRARLVERLVRRGEIAVGIAAAAVENAAGAASARNAAAHKFAFVAFRALDAESDGPRVLALRIIRAADEIAEAALAAQQLRVVERAFFIERNIRLARDARATYQAARGFAIRVALAGEKNAQTAALDDHFLAAIIAIFDFRHAVRFRRKLGRKILDVIAIRIAIAAQEKSVARNALQQFTLAAFFALQPGGNPGLVGQHLLVGLIEIHDERIPEFLHRLAPGQLAFFDFVELFLEARGEADVENILETFYQQHADAFAEHGGREAALILGDVFAFDDRGNDGGVGGGAANALFFQFFHQRRVVVTRRRLGEMLVRANLVEAQGLAFADLRQRAALAFIILFVVLAVGAGDRGLVNAQVAIEFLD